MGWIGKTLYSLEAATDESIILSSGDNSRTELFTNRFSTGKELVELTECSA